MDLGLKGRNAVVLGGTRGIGRAIADTLAGEGAGVAVCARNADQVAGTVTELQAMGVKATGTPLDVTDAAALKSWISDAAGSWAASICCSPMPGPWRKAAIPLHGSRTFGSTCSAP